MRRTLSVFATLVVLAGHDIAAQAALYSSVGHQVRLKTDSSSQWLTGTLVAADADSLRLGVGDQGSPVAVARRTVAQLEVLYRGHSHAGRGAAIGFGLGALSGAIIGYGSYRACTGSCTFDPGPGVYTLAGALGGGVVGIVVGAAIGTITRGGGWQPVSLGPTHVTLAPRGGGVELRLAF